jgi:DNA polymerase I
MPMNTKTPFILVDGSSYLHRAYHALPPLTTSKGLPTGAIYGVIKMIKSLVAEYKPIFMAIVFDAKGKNFRHELYPAYKAHRPPMQEDLRVQIQPLHAIIKAMGLPILMIEGVEADDVIGTLAKQAAQLKLNTLISTGDKDFAQLVNEHITLINTMSNTTLTPKSVKEKFGVPPELIIDYLTLVGDTSDNIPGVPKVGPKTAVKWLHEYGSLDNLIAHVNEIPGKVGENLRNSLAQLPLAKQLVTIKCDVKLDVGPKDLFDKPDDNEKLAELCEQLEFKAWLVELNKQPVKKESAEYKQNYQTILTEKDFNLWLDKLKNAACFSIDTETTSLNYMAAKIVGISFATEAGTAAYIPLAHDYPDVPQQLDFKFVLAKLKPILENENIKKLGQNLKYDKEIFLNYNINLRGIAFDTMLESYIFNSTATRHDMNSLALKYLQHKTITYEEVAGKGAKQISFAAINITQASHYAAEDADIALQLHQYFWPQISENEKLKKVLTDIEIPLIDILVKMERYGVLIDAELLKKQSNNIAHRLLELEQKVYQISGVIFNLDSPKQLQEILYQKLAHPIIKKTPTGQPSTAEPILQELALNFPLPKLILEYRSLSKLKSTYTDRLPEQVNPQTKRIHTSYHQAVAATGRLSSSHPNLQNIPIRSEAGRCIRQAFIAPKGYKLLAADYSQIELRIIAHLSQDENLLDAFAKGLDIHKATAAEVFGVDLDNVTKDQRRKAKAINFGLIYGMSAFGLAKQTGIERTTAQTYIDAYFANYPKVREYMKHMRQFAHKHGFVETLFGRRLYIQEINSRNIQHQRAAERAAINAPTQGTAADIIKIAMIKVDEWIQASQIKANILMQVHDELVFEIDENQIKEASQSIQKIMSEAAKLSVPLTVDIGVGNNWDEAH